MSNLTQKLLEIFIGEFVEAVIFIMLLIVAGTLPNDEISKQIITIIISCWVIFGIGTPIVIFLELEKEVLNIFKGLK